MINTIEALQGLYVALGGELADVANITLIPDMLTKISEVAQAAASELPVVKKTDEGKVLTVDNKGKWVAADAPEGLPTPDYNNSLLRSNDGEWEESSLENVINDITYNNDGFLFMESGNGLEAKNLLWLMNYYTSSTLGQVDPQAGDFIYYNGEEWVIGNPSSQE